MSFAPSRTRLSCAVRASLLAVTVAATAPAAATDTTASASVPVSAPSAVGNAESPTKTLDAVTVTGQRPRLFEIGDVNAGALGMRDLKDLPFSIGSFATDTIEEQRARTALDVLKNDPSVTPATPGASYDGIAVRGFSANALNNVRRDGLATNVYMDVPLENKERVDVLKGLSGFLYGVGEPSGVVNYVLKRPTRDPFVSLTGEATNHDGRYFAVDAGGPMANGGAGYRVNAASEKVGDYRHYGDLERNFVSAAFDFRLGENALLQLDADYQKKQLAASALVGPRSDGTVVPADSFDPRTLVGQPWGRYRSRGWNLGSRLDVTLASGWLLTTQLGASRTGRDAAFPDVYEVAPNGDVLSGDYYYAPDQKFETTAGQSYLSGKLGDGSIRHDLVFGVAAARNELRDGGFLVFPETVGNIYAPRSFPRPDLDQATAKNRTRTTQRSVFASDTLSLGDYWQVLAGARYLRYSSDTAFAAGGQRDFSVDSTVPTAGLLFKPSAAVTFYGTYTQGFEQGAYAPVWAANGGQRLDPIKSRQHELGVKWQALPSLLATAAWFDIDKPLQEVDPADKVFKQHGRQHHRGLEVTANGAITERLSVIAGASWLDAAQEDTGNARLEGKRPSNTARFQANAFVDYRLAAIEGLSLNAGYFHVGNRYLDRANAQRVPGYDRWDAGVAYTTRLAGNPSVLRLYAENLTDHRYWQSAIYGGVLQGNPSTVHLSMTVEL